MPRVEGADVEKVYYQERDYIRFRREVWQEQMLDFRIKARRQRVHEFQMQERDTTKSLVSRSGAHTLRHAGIARTA